MRGGISVKNIVVRALLGVTTQRRGAIRLTG